MTEPAEHRPQSAADEPSAATSTDRRAKARDWARRVLAHRPDPVENEQIRARLGLRSRRGAA